MKNERCEKVFLLRKIRFGESDLILHALNGQGAKISLIARGAVKSRRRFAGGILEPTNFILANYRDAGPGHLSTLSEAQLVRSFDGLKESYDRLELALHMLSLVDRMAQEGDVGSENVFHLLGNSLASVSRSDHLELLRVQFEAKLLYYYGVLPQIKDIESLLQNSLEQHRDISISSVQLRDFNTQFKSVFENYLQMPMR